MIVVVDTETTGLEAVDVAVEIAAVMLSGEPLTVTQYDSSLVCPEPIQISYGAMATHHIRQSDVIAAPPLPLALGDVGLSNLPDDTVLAAHNAAFDRGMLPQLSGYPWLCTWRCARHLWPNAPSHKNQVLRYWMDLPEPPEGVRELPPHRALPDAWVTAQLLLKMLQVRPLAELILLQDAPVLLRTVGFGKHFGQLWENVDKSYLRWILNQDFDDDTKYTARHWLGVIR